MNRLLCSMLLLPCLALLVLAAGCGEPTVAPEDAYDPADFQGEVDTSLPEELQKKQQAIRDAFEPLVRGVLVEDLGVYLENIRFESTTEEFLPSGTIALERWGFDGKPSGNDVPVVMHFVVDGAEGETKEVERVYTVTTSGGQTVIRLKQ